MASSAWSLKTPFFIFVLLTLTETNEETERGPNNNNNNNKNGKSRFVKYLDEESYQQFINTSNVEIVYFQKKDSRRVQTFLKEYENSAERLLAFGIYLLLVDCQQFSISNYCEDDRSLHYAFGFRNGIEKIALPLDTLFDVDSIVASALHLSLIHNVPIIQTLSERKALERKCNGRYDIVFSYQKALGTYEHRVFMELAYTFLDKYVFAMTISERAVQDLRHFSEETLKSFNDPDYNSHIEPTLWILYCQSVTDHKDECSQNFYYGRFHYLDVFHFVQSLDAPQWVEFPNQNMEEKIPYNLSEIHLLYILVTDEDQLPTLISTYKHLGQMFAGSVGLLFLRMDKISNDGLTKLNLLSKYENKSNFAWKTKGQMTLTWKQDCDDLQQFILGHLRAESNQLEDPNKQDLTTENHTWESNDEEVFDELSELHQDDMVAEYVRLSASNSSQILELSEADYSINLQKQELTLVLFYVKWDPNCQATIQTLVEVQNHFATNELNSEKKPLVCKVDCFDWPKLCQNNAINVYPTIKIFSLRSNRSITYQNIIQNTSIISALNMFNMENPLLLQSDEDALHLIKGNWSFIFPTFIQPDFIILIGFTSSQKNEGMSLVMELTSRMFGKTIISYVIDDSANNMSVAKYLKTEKPFLTMVKLNDHFKPIVIYKEGKSILDKNFNFEVLRTFIDENCLNSFAELTPADFPSYRQQSDKSLLIYFRNLNENSHEGIWTTIGKLSSLEKYSHILFTWMKTSDSLAETLMNFYKLKKFEPSVVRIYFEKGTYSSIQGQDLISPEVFEQWLEDSSQFNTDKLLSSDWKPLHPGFDYLRLIDEDLRIFDEKDSLSASIGVNSESRDGFKDPGQLLRLPIKSKNVVEIEKEYLKKNEKEDQRIRNEL